MLPNNGKMEVLTSKYRMSATTFFHFTSVKMLSPDYYAYHNNPAEISELKTTLSLIVFLGH